MPLSGSLSSFTPSAYNLDSFTLRQAGDLITTADWNHLGDALYNIEKGILTLSATEKNFRLIPEARLYAGVFHPTWNMAVSGQLSVTGQIILPTSACLTLGTYEPLNNQNLVKVSVRRQLASSLRNFEGSGVTSAIYCPYEAGKNPKTSEYVQRTPGQQITGGNIAAYSPALNRTIIVGLYFEGFPVPSDINTWGLECSVFIAARG